MNSSYSGIYKLPLYSKLLSGLKFRIKPLTSTINFYFILGADLCLFFLAHLLSYCIRFEFYLNPSSVNQMISVLVFLLPLKAFIFWAFGLYLGMWRYAGTTDLWRLLKATIISSLVIVSVILFIHRFGGFSRGVFILDGTLTFLFAGGLRFGIRTFYQKKTLNYKGRHELLNRKPVFIIGAGNTGEKTLREFMGNSNLPYQVIGFIDDDSQKKGRSIHDIPVLGGVKSLCRNADFYGVKNVLIATPSASGSEMRKIVEECESCNLEYKTLPSWGEIIDGRVSVKTLRDVDYKDLLRRSPVNLNIKEIESYLKAKCVLVTGAGGSIGSELCRQIVRFKPELLILMDMSEASLYNIQMELKHRIGYLKYVPILTDVQNTGIVESVFQRYKPEVVFHAAAYKHVPMMEENPWQAVHNNIRGTYTIMSQSVRHNTEYFVLISTDKAVRPTNVMGASKRMCELLLQSFQGNKTRMMAVRFGNVLASSGSVIPLFKKQIARGGPVTITHPEITRYFMTIPEAAQLVLQAGSQGEGGEIFILDMGTPVKIADMANDLIRFSGKEPGLDIEIIFTGLRPGEKLYEELITDGEGIVPTSHEKIMVLKPNGYYKEHGSPENFRQWLMNGAEELYTLADRQDACAIKNKLHKLVPEYDVQDTECVL
ncbi:nucleoside-diphosphate sugar epimerase/dehydratase [Desulfobacterales bacterium HSG17]|nr:nucleoside-diphosphate sugar epimerase/dehydratase [Desulfobacterales bacterium HSG17]